MSFVGHHLLRRLTTLFLFTLFLGGSLTHGADGESAFLKIHANQPGFPRPVAVRAIVLKADGNYVSGEWGPSDWPAVMLRGKAVTPEMVLEVPPGETTITVGKGPDYVPQTITTNLAEAGKTYVISVDLQPALNLYEKGWRGGDAHLHFFHGDDQISRTPEEAYAVCAAGGMSYASLADEHFGTPFLTRDEMARTWRAFDGTECQVWIGAEAPKNAWGHHAAILYDPWSVRGALPYHWGINEVHLQGGVSYPVHPDRNFPGRFFGSDPALFPLNNHYKFYPIAALAGHLLDGWSGISDQGFEEQQLKPYFKLLEMGYKIPLLSDSDFCMDRVNNGLKAPGFWMNYVHLGDEPVTRAAVANAIRKGRVMATTGPLVLFSIDDALPGDSLAADGTERILRIEASYKFNPWTLSDSNFDGTAKCKLDSVELIRNGEVIRTWTPDSSEEVLEEPITETTNAFYMVRVLGNEGVWMAGYSSPIYFETNALPRQPEVFKGIVNGRVYDSATGEPVSAHISCVRYGRTEWTLPTDTNGLFRAKVPIDAELVARDEQGRELTRGLLNYEPAYAFCHYLPERYTGKAESIAEFAELMREVTWEFPMGWQNASSYVRKNLEGDGAVESATILNAPEWIEGKTHPEIVAVVTDKTRVQAGDRIHYSVIVRAKGEKPERNRFAIAWRGWNPTLPRMYSRYGTLIKELPINVPLQDLGSGFYSLSGSMDVPSWVANSGPTTGALRFSARVVTGEILEEVNLTVTAGETRRELLVSSTWDGLASTWGDMGIGRCLFSRDGTFKVRYPDYRKMELLLTVNGEEIRVSPVEDTAHVADADDALFEDHLYYDAQCEPEYRNIPFRDVPRYQPAPIDFSELYIADPADTSAPMVVAIEPFADAVVSSPVRFYSFVHEAGLSGAAAANLYVDGQLVSSNALENPVVVELESGDHTWEVEGIDREGNIGRSPTRRLVVAPRETEVEPVMLNLLSRTNAVFGFSFESTPGRTYLIEQATSLFDWRVLLRTNVITQSVTIEATDGQNPTKSYRVRTEPLPE